MTWRGQPHPHALGTETALTALTARGKLGDALPSPPPSTRGSAPGHRAVSPDLGSGLKDKLHKSYSFLGN